MIYRADRESGGFIMNSFKKIIRRVITLVSAFMLLCCSATLTTICPDVSAAKDPELTPQEKADMIVVLTNEARQELGLPKLYAVPLLNEYATTRAKETTFFFAHNRLDGTLFSSIIDYDKLPYASVKENIAGGSETPDGCFEQWRNSSGHWKNIINEDITHMGAGYCFDDTAESKWYWDQLFMSFFEFDAWEDIEGLEGAYIPERYKIVPQCCGDLNGDGNVDTFDYVLIMKHIDDGYYFNDLQVEAADCFQDGMITSADAQALQRFILGGIKQLPMSLFG